MIDIVDTTTRDGNQSLWSATGLTTPDVLSIAPTMERVGFHALTGYHHWYIQFFDISRCNRNLYHNRGPYNFRACFHAR